MTWQFIVVGGIRFAYVIALKGDFMKLQYFQGPHPNFGDELNPWLWPKLLPSFLDEDSSTLFLGIGSIIGTAYDDQALKVVFGSGFSASYHYKPDVHDGKWDVFFIRGPRTAERLGLSKDLAIGDSAILLRAVVKPIHRPKTIGFMPHWESLDRGDWGRVCSLAGITLIDPRKPVEQVMDAILQCKVLVAEAMHGAIVADALRVPWIPLLPIHGNHRDKWYDWAGALDLTLRPFRLWPSSPLELGIAVERHKALSAAASALSSIKGAESALQHLAAKRLQKLAQEEPQLSQDSAIENATERMLEQIEKLKRKYS